MFWCHQYFLYVLTLSAKSLALVYINAFFNIFIYLKFSWKINSFQKLNICKYILLTSIHFHYNNLLVTFFSWNLFRNNHKIIIPYSHLTHQDIHWISWFFSRYDLCSDTSICSFTLIKAQTVMYHSHYPFQYLFLLVQLLLGTNIFFMALPLIWIFLNCTNWNYNLVLHLEDNKMYYTSNLIFFCFSIL